MAYLRSEEMWRMSVSEIRKTGRRNTECITLVLILPDTMTQQQAAATGFSHPL